MAYICEWGSLPVRFNIHFLEPYWVCLPPRNALPSILLAFVQRPFSLIVHNFILRRVFNCIQGTLQRYLQFYLFFYSILISFQIYIFYALRYFIQSSKVQKKPKYNSFRNKSRIYTYTYIYIVYIYVYLKIYGYMYIL